MNIHDIKAYPTAIYPEISLAQTVSGKQETVAKETIYQGHNIILAETKVFLQMFGDQKGIVHLASFAIREKLQE